MKNRKGFTIVELVIVIAVIAILAAVLIPTFAGVISKANESAALQKATSTMKATLAMSKTAVISDHTLFAIADASKTTYMYEYTNNAIAEESKIQTITAVHGGTTTAADELKYDRIIVNNALITGTGDSVAFTAEADKIKAAITTTVTGAKAVAVKARGTTLSGTTPLMKDEAASFEVVVYNDATATAAENIIAVLAVYISSDYAKDVVTFVPATQLATN